MMMQRLFAVSGFSFSGKTFLMEQLISGLKAEGFSVASVKSTKEDIVAPEGTDTWRHSKAGADPTLLLGPNTSTIRMKEQMSLLKFTNSLDVDFVLLEGFKDSDFPKFWCIGESNPDMSFQPANVKAYVVWDGSECPAFGDDIPVFSNSDIESLVAIVKKEGQIIRY